MIFRIFKTAAALAGLFMGAAFMISPKKTNPPVIREHTIQANTDMTPEAAHVLARACMNCHSNETRWPVYSYVPPFSWMVTRDVEKARKVMNFSDWSVQAGRRPALAASFLASACSDMRVKRMPTEAYVMVHPESRLSKNDVDGFCTWTREEIARIKDRKAKGELRASR